MGPFTITDEVLADIERHVAAHPAERGGALLDHLDLPGLISLFIPDPSAETTPVSYIRSDQLVELVHLLEQRSGYRYCGLVHSHPAGVESPSGPDERALENLLDVNPRLQAVAGPIVTVGKPHRPHHLELP